ncbi:hypothetical protein AAFF_G00039970 [Aldrovandia affinis]|uniref:Uncharacterized protein n=1 Tax=Aldrovandia affinis TaxID=143900 RepID=A0AAD7S5A4_9TELE|nr:hypothetical protein AAFF_G00039970 [Aldrovandia affinis]
MQTGGLPEYAPLRRVTAALQRSAFFGGCDGRRPLGRLEPSRSAWPLSVSSTHRNGTAGLKQLRQPLSPPLIRLQAQIRPGVKLRQIEHRGAEERCTRAARTGRLSARSEEQSGAEPGSAALGQNFKHI